MRARLHLNFSAILSGASAAAVALCLSGCATLRQHEGAQPVAQGVLARADGGAVGTVSVSAMGEHLHVAIAVRDFTPGTYGSHLHAVGRCEGPAFASAGGHLNPGGHQHGRLNPMGTHMGDLPNLIVDATGRGVMDFELSAAAASLFDVDGTALIIHAAADDERTDPSGNSGARFACAVLNPAR